MSHSAVPETRPVNFWERIPVLFMLGGAVAGLLSVVVGGQFIGTPAQLRAEIIAREAADSSSARDRAALRADIRQLQDAQRFNTFALCALMRSNATTVVLTPGCDRVPPVAPPTFTP